MDKKLKSYTLNQESNNNITVNILYDDGTYETKTYPSNYTYQGLTGFDAVKKEYDNLTSEQYSFAEDFLNNNQDSTENNNQKLQDTSNNKGEFNLEYNPSSGYIEKQIGSYKYVIKQDNPSDTIIAKIYYNGELIAGEGLFGGIQKYVNSYEYENIKGVLGVEKWLLVQFNWHNDSPRFNSSTTNEYFPPVDIPRITEDQTTSSSTTENNNSDQSKSSNEPPKAVLSAEGFETKEVPLIKGDGSVKNDLGVIKMTPLKDATELDKIEASQLDSKQVETLSKPPQPTPEYIAQKKLTDLIISLKGTALPLAITLISSFGVTKASNLIAQGKTQVSDIPGKIKCPSPEELSKLIERKNKLVRQINRSLNTIEKTNKILGITGNVINVLDIAFKVLKNLPIPSSTGIVGVPGLPVSVILGIQDNKTKIDKTITTLKAINIGVLTTLVIVSQILTQLLQYLSLLDNLVQNCSDNSDETQEKISNELLALTTQQSQDVPVVTNVNGFEMNIETENTTNSLKRKRAIAKNKQGLIMLKGEWSFSSIDQILIDELVFYIQQNNLKAD